MSFALWLWATSPCQCHTGISSLGAQVVQPGKLVVDQRFQRADVNAAHAEGISSENRVMMGKNAASVLRRPWRR